MLIKSHLLIPPAGRQSVKVKPMAGDGILGWTKAPLSAPLDAVRGDDAHSTISMLMEAAANINLRNGRGHCPLWNAVSEGAMHNGRGRLVSLLSFRADVNVCNHNGETVFYRACDIGRFQWLQRLLDAHAEVNKADNRGASPLLAASRRGSLQTCQRLVAARADIHQANKKGITPVWAASRAGWASVVEVLHASSADVNMPNRFGVTPLIIASGQDYYKKRVKVVQKLLELSADKDKSDDHGVSALWMACLRGNLKSARLLLDAKVDQEQATRKGISAMQVAYRSGHEAVVQLLGHPEQDSDDRGIP